MKLLLSCIAATALIGAILMAVLSALPLEGDLTHDVRGM
ncbi:hypothetical protein UFOVP191_37 [uncultured Caudovirales phage]|uniref:Uncharacterized protein n=1 Tax=uncultured Caudovirales phage TaxID=2100421 RepID=A0A6J7WG42_9CAUD|nr:hypothetical protein UFOVP191_37 [uncultured Caudovirales phage]